MSPFMAFQRILLPRSALSAILLLSFCAGAAQAQTLPLTSGPVLPLYRALRDVGLDSQRVYKIREAAIDREDVHLWLNDGTIAFTQSVDGRITGAYFEGEGEVLVRPPDRRERASLGLFTSQGVLEEQFSSGYLRFNDDTAQELQQYLRPAEDGAAFVARNDALARRLAAMDAMRMAIAFTSLPPDAAQGESAVPDRLLHARVASEHLGIFDVYFDTRASEQIMVGKTTTVQEVTYYDLWMSFAMRSARQDASATSRFHGPIGPAWTRDAVQVTKYTIKAAIDPLLDLSADATLDGTVRQGGARILMFELSRYLHLKSVELEGKPLEFIQNEAIEGSELSRRGNDQVAVVFPQPLLMGAQLRLKFAYQGSVLSDAGGGLFYVGARGTWYPNRGIAMADYDVTFRFPLVWTLVATGKQASLEKEGAQWVGHWISEGPIPIAGFNLGIYVHSTAKSGAVAVDSYATRGVETDMASLPHVGAVPTSQSPMPPEVSGAVATGEPAPNPAIGGAQLAVQAADTIASLAKMFGRPYPFSSLALTQRPGMESQGWPGMIFLSSYVYLTPAQRQAQRVSAADNVLFGEVMMPHEVAHQWFGDRVSWASYHEQWLLEAIANYSSLMLLEQNRPADVQVMLEAYRELLANKSKQGAANVDAGPVTLGLRLSSSKFPSGYEIIAYGRGTWLIHMLREMLRDASRTEENPEGSDQVFLALLRSLYDRYQGQEITNAAFERAAEDVLPKSLWFDGHKSLDWFFDGWVNGTAFPRFEIKDARFSTRTGKPMVSATLRQIDAPEDLVTSIPVYGTAGDTKVFLGRVFAEGQETRISLPVPPGVKRLVLDPYQTVLTAP